LVVCLSQARRLRARESECERRREGAFLSTGMVNFGGASSMESMAAELWTKESVQVILISEP